GDTFSEQLEDTLNESYSDTSDITYVPSEYENAESNESGESEHEERAVRLRKKPDRYGYSNMCAVPDVKAWDDAGDLTLQEALDDRIAAALLEENDTSSDDENFLPSSDDEADHISEASEVRSDTDVEDAENNLEPYLDDTSQPFYLGKDGRTKWYKSPPRTNVRTRAENLITHLPGCKDAARHKKTQLECFETFFTDEIIDMVLIYTNQKITSRMENSTSNPSYGETNKAEIKALFGLLFLACLDLAGKVL
ncbi:hypothetical protein HF086_017710, partial [Spodoptera exigua]